MRSSKLILACVLAILLIITTTPPLLVGAGAQTLSSDEVRLEIEKLEINTSDEPANAPQPSEDFRKQGYTVESIKTNSIISEPFKISPSSYLIRSKPGKSIILPITIHNFASPVVLQTKLIAFSEPAKGAIVDKTGNSPQQSIDCSRVKIASCTALNWLTTDTNKNNFFIEAGEKKSMNLNLNIVQNAQEGDYYIKLLLEEYKKPYNYTSSSIYITITKKGIISQNISTQDLTISPSVPLPAGLPVLLTKNSNYTLSVNIENGANYYSVFIPNLAINSLFGFRTTKAFSPIILLANQSKTILIKIDQMPKGFANLQLNSAEVAAILLPFPLLTLTIIAIIALLIVLSIIKIK